MEHIHQMLQSGQLGWGDRVSEEAIAQQIGISRTPVREALHIFCEMGVFRRLARFGTVVRIPEAREIEELFEIRVALEGYAVAEAIKYISPQEIARLEETCNRMRELDTELLKNQSKRLSPENISTLYMADHDFHLGIIRATGNRMLLKNVSDNRMLTRLLSFRVSRFGETNVSHIHAQHRAIFEAIQAKDGPKARELLEAHIRESKHGSVTDIKKELDALAEKESQHLGLSEIY
nr:GntR family transcriptional regulator [Ruficoccus amylovorans]